MAKALSDKIAALKARQDAIAAQLSAAQTKAKEEDRKHLARRKSVIGGAILAAIEKDDGLADIVVLALAEHVQSPTDREVVADLLERLGDTVKKVSGSAKGSKAA